MRYAKTHQDIKTAEMLYSVAKLSSYIHEKSDVYQNAEADIANTEALHELLVIESQNRIVNVKPNIVVDRSKRIPLEGLINEYLNLADETNQYPGEEVDNSHNTDVLDYLYTVMALINTGLSIAPAHKRQEILLGIKKTWMFSLKFDLLSWCQIIELTKSKTYDFLSAEIENIYKTTYFYQLLNMISSEVETGSLVSVLLPSPQDDLQKLLLVSISLHHYIYLI